MKHLLLFIFLFTSISVPAQTRPFRFAFLSDTHIGSPNGAAEEDLRRTVADINAQDSIDFVVITGDITELGTNAELRLAKQILDSLDIPYYIIPGNHDTGWSESGGLSFTRVFGYDKFFFRHQGVYFIGCPSGPYVRMSDGHVPRDAMNWMKEQLKKVRKDEPLIFLNHYPLDNGLDNWYEVIDQLKTKNTILALCGHGHSNRPVQAEEIPAVMGRSNLRAKAAEGGYNLVDLRMDSILFIERKPLTRTEKLWTGVKLERKEYDRTKKFPRPDFSMNASNPRVKAVWTYQSAANVISTPAVMQNRLVVFGNQNGLVEALDLNTGKRKWTFQTGGPVFSSPATASGLVVLGSADGYVYALSESGKLRWKFKTQAAVLGAPLIADEKVYIGGSDGAYRCLDLKNGNEVWRFEGLGGPVVSKPVLHKNLLLFGAWDRYLYAYDIQKKQLAWKWSNGSSVINFSPAACIPIVHGGLVYVVAPDRYLSAIDLETGQTVWRTNEATVRESQGLSENGNLIYGKTMQDTLVAFATGRDKKPAAWKMHVGYGYEHTPSTLVEKDSKLFFGTRNGIVYAINPSTREKLWAYRIDNSMVNTLNVLTGKKLVAATMDGKVCLLQDSL